jgi:hypothetical protein
MKYSIIVLLILLTPSLMAQQLKTKNVIIVTLDGYRWQELYKGADPDILKIPEYNKEPGLGATFEAPTSIQRRERLMPFFWNVISKEGQLYGNRSFGNKVNCSNHHLLSYPGYSEMLVGYPERTVTSNRKIVNPNATVLEFIHGQHEYHNKVAAFATWDAFPFILRKEKAKFHVNAGSDLAEGSISSVEVEMNRQLKESNHRTDHLTFQYAMEYLKRERPNVLFLGFDATDTYAHGGQYDKYLQAAYEADRMIAQLWQWIQSQPDYKDQTTIFITTDHGRGNGRHIWRNHRLLASGSRQIWFAVMGPDTPAFGEMKFKAKTYQNQVAKTIAAFMGLNYHPEHPTGEIIQTMLGVPQPYEINVPSEQTLALPASRD